MYNKQPKMFYDYYGFPSETYKYEYPAKCDLKLTDKVFKLLKDNGFNPQLNIERGWYLYL